MSVSDIVVINDENGSHAYYVDSVGYKDITNMFLNRTEMKQHPTITCEWSESTVFEDGKTYSVYEFDNLMNIRKKSFKVQLNQIKPDVSTL